jgi:hypothetical protein
VQPGEPATDDDDAVRKARLLTGRSHASSLAKPQYAPAPLGYTRFGPSPVGRNVALKLVERLAPREVTGRVALRTSRTPRRASYRVIPSPRDEIRVERGFVIVPVTTQRPLASSPELAILRSGLTIVRDVLLALTDHVTWW